MFAFTEFQMIQPAHPRSADAASPQQGPARVRLQDLMQRMREIEIDHDGKIYRLRLTQSNKLILTA